MTPQLDARQIERLSATIAMPGDEYSASFVFDSGRFFVSWSPSVPGPDQPEEFYLHFQSLQRGFCEAVATLIGTPVVVASVNGEEDYVAHPLPAGTLGTVN